MCAIAALRRAISMTVCEAVLSGIGRQLTRLSNHETAERDTHHLIKPLRTPPPSLQLEEATSWSPSLRVSRGRW